MSLRNASIVTDDFEPPRYRALSPLAVVSVAAGALSIVTVFAWWLAAVPLVGIILGWLALGHIRRAPEERTGLGVAKLGIGLSLGLWAMGYAWLIFDRASEVPHGYQRVDWEQLQPDPGTPSEPIPQKAQDLHEKKIFIKGFIQPRRQQTGIKEFIFCPGSGDCPYCIANPTRTQMIRVVMQGDLEVDYTTHAVGVAGKLLVDSTDPRGIPYVLEADLVR